GRQEGGRLAAVDRVAVAPDVDRCPVRHRDLVDRPVRRGDLPSLEDPLLGAEVVADDPALHDVLKGELPLARHHEVEAVLARPPPAPGGVDVSAAEYGDSAGRELADALEGGFCRRAPRPGPPTAR